MPMPTSVTVTKPRGATIPPEELTRIRTDAGLSIAQAAFVGGVNIRTWRSWEDGTRNMPAARFDEFLVAYMKWSDEIDLELEVHQRAARYRADAELDPKKRQAILDQASRRNVEQANLRRKMEPAASVQEHDISGTRLGRAVLAARAGGVSLPIPYTPPRQTKAGEFPVLDKVAYALSLATTARLNTWQLSRPILDADPLFHASWVERCGWDDIATEAARRAIVLERGGDPDKVTDTLDSVALLQS